MAVQLTNQDDADRAPEQIRQIDLRLHEPETGHAVALLRQQVDCLGSDNVSGRPTRKELITLSGCFASTVATW